MKIPPIVFISGDLVSYENLPSGTPFRFSTDAAQRLLDAGCFGSNYPLGVLCERTFMKVVQPGHIQGNPSLSSVWAVDMETGQIYGWNEVNLMVYPVKIGDSEK